MMGLGSSDWTWTNLGYLWYGSVVRGSLGSWSMTDGQLAAVFLAMPRFLSGAV